MRFYEDKATDTSGRRITDMWNYNPSQLEGIHNYIQWLFPLTEGSAFNQDAPLLSGEDIQAFRTEPALRQNALKSFGLLLNFYGFELKEIDGKFSVSRGSNYGSRTRNWLSPYNHNFLRITRILKFLKLIGEDLLASAFFKSLEQVYQESPVIVGKSYDFWRSAV